LVLGVASDGVAWQTTQTRAIRAGFVGAQREDDLESALQGALTEAGVIHVGSVDVVLACELSCHWMMVPPSGLRSLGELRTLAALRCCELFGGQPSQWLVSGDWQLTRAFVCVAASRRIVECVVAACRSRRLQPALETAVGIVLRRYAPVLPDNGWTCLRTPRALILLCTSQGRPNSLRVMRQHPAAGWTDAVQSATVELTRESSRLNLPVPRCVDWLDGLASDRTQTLEAEGIRFQRRSFRMPDDSSVDNEAQCIGALGSGANHVGLLR
jgi:hypothetical protein